MTQHFIPTVFFVDGEDKLEDEDDVMSCKLEGLEQEEIALVTMAAIRFLGK